MKNSVYTPQYIPTIEEISISQIAEQVGFSDYCHFSKTFKKIIGVTPSMYFQKRYLL